MPPKSSTPEPTRLTGAQRARLAAAHRARERAHDRARAVYDKAIAAPLQTCEAALEAADEAYDAAVAGIMRELGADGPH